LNISTILTVSNLIIIKNSIFFLHRVDPETTFKIEAKVDGFWKKQDDCKKVYVKGRKLQWVVDSDRFSLCDLRSYLLEDLSWGRLQTPMIWILDQNEGTKATLEFESQIPDMFKLYQREKVVLLHVQVCDTNISYPCTPVQPTPAIAIGSQSQPRSHSDDGDTPNDHEYVGVDDEYMYIFDGDVGLDQEARINPSPIMSTSGLGCITM
jgi:hypothetical protein